LWPLPRFTGNWKNLSVGAQSNAGKDDELGRMSWDVVVRRQLKVLIQDGQMKLNNNEERWSVSLNARWNDNFSG